MNQYKGTSAFSHRSNNNLAVKSEDLTSAYSRLEQILTEIRELVSQEQIQNISLLNELLSRVSLEISSNQFDDSDFFRTNGFILMLHSIFRRIPEPPIGPNVLGILNNLIYNHQELSSDFDELDFLSVLLSSISSNPGNANVVYLLANLVYSISFYSEASASKMLSSRILLEIPVFISSTISSSALTEYDCSAIETLINLPQAAFHWEDLFNNETLGEIVHFSSLILSIPSLQILSKTLNLIISIQNSFEESFKLLLSESVFEKIAQIQSEKHLRQAFDILAEGLACAQSAEEISSIAEIIHPDTLVKTISESLMSLSSGDQCRLSESAISLLGNLIAQEHVSLPDLESLDLLLMWKVVTDTGDYHMKATTAFFIVCAWSVLPLDSSIRKFDEESCMELLSVLSECGGEHMEWALNSMQAILEKSDNSQKEISAEPLAAEFFDGLLEAAESEGGRNAAKAQFLRTKFSYQN